jgi:hypothetical protein
MLYPALRYPVLPLPEAGEIVSVLVPLTKALAGIL